jgi:catechol 2,3-dioxygenase-like lactoylglutathione lyase family enzyme
MIRKLSHATIYVKDQASALDFYTNKLGFAVRSDITMNGFRWLTVSPHDQTDLEMVLMPVTPGGPLDAESIAHLRALLDKGALGPGVLETDDCRATYEELKRKGVEFIAPPQDRAYGVEAHFNDNQGNPYTLIQHKRANGG